MRGILLVILQLFLLGFLVGDGLIAAIAAYQLFRTRRRSSTYKYFSGLFLAVALAPVIWLITSSTIPRPQPLSFQLWSLLGLGVLAIGVWPAALHVLGLWGYKEITTIENAIISDGSTSLKAKAE